jgi:hypothetical protein
MKKTLILTAAVLAMFSPPLAHATDDMRVLLKLERLVDGKVAGSVELFGNTIDPNTQSTDDHFRLEVNGKKVSVPERLLSRLVYQRRSYSYDELSGGVSNSEGKALCRMAGPAKGERLLTLYVTYTDYKITASELRPVLTDASNCLFKLNSKPNDADATLAAAKTLASLQLLYELNNK